MELKLKAKVQIHKQYDWRFWLKLICAILPIASTIIFLIAQGVDLFHDPKAFWDSTLGTGVNRVRVQSEHALRTMSHNQMGAYLFCRNILMITTLGNFLNSAWFINSAVNNKYEGQGKFDNKIFGTMAVNTIVFIVLFYNLALIPSHEILHHMHWYNWVSWMCEHMVPGLVMMVYFFVFYPKMNAKYTDKKLREWFIEMAIAISFVVAFNVLFVILGYIFRAAHTTRIFGEMSYTGYFPYPFMNFLNENKQVVGHNNTWIRPWMEFVIVMIVQVLEQVLSFVCIHTQNTYQEKIQWMYK